jgi:hypothetical protein
VAWKFSLPNRISNPAGKGSELHLWYLYSVRITIEMAGGKLIFSANPLPGVPTIGLESSLTLTSTSAEIYLSMAGAKQLRDTSFILVPAGAVHPAGVCSRHCIALRRVLAEGGYKRGGRGGSASRSLRFD